MIEKENKKWVKTLLTVSFIFYVWYLASTLLLPLSNLVYIPDFLLITIYKLAEFPPSILGFVICVSLISTIIVLKDFREQKTASKIFLIQGITFSLYFIIPIVATVLLLVLIATINLGRIPSERIVSNFLEDLFIFTSALFLLTGALNFATYRILKVSKICEESQIKAQE